MEKQYRLFIRKWLVLTIATLILFCCILLYLSMLFEHNLYSSIIQRQIKNNSLYGSALNVNPFGYHLEKIKIIKPDIIVIGTSRAGQFKQKYFKNTFLTTPNASNTLAQAKTFIQEIVKIYKPKLMIFCLEPWWLNEKYPNYTNTNYHHLNGTNITAEKITHFFTFSLTGKIPFSTDFIFTNKISNPLTKYDSLGLDAINNSNGSFIDGSYLYGSLIYGKTPHQDFQFKDTLWRIQNQNSYFLYGAHLDPKKLQNFIEIQNFITSHNIQLITIIPPLAPSIYAIMMKQYEKQYQYIHEVHQWAQKNQIYDFFNPSILTTDDCEFYDGFHGGDVYYAKILEYIGRHNQTLLPYLNLNNIHWVIQNKSGLAYSGEHINGLYEKDFSGIGCQKRQPQSQQSTTTPTTQTQP